MVETADEGVDGGGKKLVGAPVVAAASGMVVVVVLVYDAQYCSCRVREGETGNKRERQSEREEKERKIDRREYVCVYVCGGKDSVM